MHNITCISSCCSREFKECHLGFFYISPLHAASLKTDLAYKRLVRTQCSWIFRACIFHLLFDRTSSVTHRLALKQTNKTSMCKYYKIHPGLARVFLTVGGLAPAHLKNPPIAFKPNIFCCDLVEACIILNCSFIY